MKATVNVVWRKDGEWRLHVPSPYMKEALGSIYKCEGSWWSANWSAPSADECYLGPYRTLAEAKKALEKALGVKR